MSIYSPALPRSLVRAICAHFLLLPVSFGVMSTSPISAPGFPRFRKFSPVPGSRPRGLWFLPDQKNQKFSPRRRAAQPFAPPGQKSSIYAEKPLCIVHNGFFVISLEMLSRILRVADFSSPNIVQSLPASSSGSASAQSVAPLCFPRPVPL